MQNGTAPASLSIALEQLIISTGNDKKNQSCWSCGERSRALASYEIARKGIGRTFQVPRIFPNLTVLQNMLVPSRLSHEEKDGIMKKVFRLARAFVNPIELQNEEARCLSGGQQKLLEFVRTSMTDPELILLDEPFTGVHPEVKEKLCSSIELAQKAGKTFVLVSLDITLIMEISDKIAVLNYGKVIAQGEPQDIQKDETVIEAFLGV